MKADQAKRQRERRIRAKIEKWAEAGVDLGSIAALSGLSRPILLRDYGTLITTARRRGVETLTAAARKVFDEMRKRQGAPR